MPSIASVATFVASALAVSATNFDASLSKNVAIYWGQGANQAPLSDVCSNPSVDIVILGFINIFPDESDAVGGYAGSNFGNACSGTTYKVNGTSTKLLDSCPGIEPGITTCQGNGKKVLLSLGGGYPAKNFLKSDTSAKNFADFLWGAFGPISSDWTGPRPFGDAIVDGFDFDIESGFLASSQPLGDDGQPLPEPESFGYATMINRLRFHYVNAADTYYISGAPQCVLPDAHLADAIAKSWFDFIFVQLYNTAECSARADIGGTTTYPLSDWETVAKYNPGAKIYLGLPADTKSSGSPDYYLTPTEVHKLASKYSALMPHFGGIMLWEAQSSKENVICGKDYAFWMKEVLSKCGLGESFSEVCPSSSSSSLISSTSSIVSSSSSTASPILTSSSSSVSSSFSEVSKSSSSISSEMSSIMSASSTERLTLSSSYSYSSSFEMSSSESSTSESPVTTSISSSDFSSSTSSTSESAVITSSASSHSSGYSPSYSFSHNYTYISSRMGSSSDSPVTTSSTTHENSAHSPGYSFSHNYTYISSRMGSTTEFPITASSTSSYSSKYSESPSPGFSYNYTYISSRMGSTSESPVTTSSTSYGSISTTSPNYNYTYISSRIGSSYIASSAEPYSLASSTPITVTVTPTSYVTSGTTTIEVEETATESCDTSFTPLSPIHVHPSSYVHGTPSAHSYEHPVTETTTVITTAYVDVCPTGLTMVSTTYTTELNPYTSTPEVPSGWTTTITVCTACVGSPTMTLTKPVATEPGAIASEAETTASETETSTVTFTKAITHTITRSAAIEYTTTVQAISTLMVEPVPAEEYFSSLSVAGKPIPSDVIVVSETPSYAAKPVVGSGYTPVYGTAASTGLAWSKTSSLPVFTGAAHKVNVGSGLAVGFVGIIMAL